MYVCKSPTIQQPPSQFSCQSIPYALFSSFAKPIKVQLSLFSFLNIVQLLSQQFVHGKHVNFVLLKNQLHAVITDDLSFVGGILEVVGFDVHPYLFDDLGSRELQWINMKFP